MYEAGVYLHGTKAGLAIGDQLLVSGRESNFEAGRVMNYVYFTATLDAAVWGAELASGEGRGRITSSSEPGRASRTSLTTCVDRPWRVPKRRNSTQSFLSREPVV